MLKMIFEKTMLNDLYEKVFYDRKSNTKKLD